MTGRPPALDGIRVLDLTQVLAGPFATMMLADFGAEVIKIEPPQGSTRYMGFAMTGEDGSGFLAINRNKKSVVIDLKNDEGLAAFRKLVESADVVVENFRPGVAAKLGIDFETLRQIQPRLIYASISGFGQEGPYSQRPGYDLLAQALSGVMSVTGTPDGPPAKAGLPFGDLTAGLFCTQGILTALVSRGTTGVGQYVETSLLDSLLALSVWESSEYWSAGRVPGPIGSAHRASAPYQAVSSSDGYFTIAVNNDRFWSLFCETLDRPDLAENPLYADNRDRLANRVALIEDIEKTTRERTTDDWVQTLVNRGIPAAPIQTYAESLTMDHVREREMVMSLEHPVEGTLNALGIPVKLSETPGTLTSAAPLLGADTETYLEQLGYGREQIDNLVAQGAVRVRKTNSHEGEHDD